MAGKPRQRRVLTLLAAAGALVVVVLAAAFWRDIAARVEFYRLFEYVGVNERGHGEYRHRKTGIVLVRVPGGTFLMGSAEDEEDVDYNECPRHEVRVSPFLIAKYEITEEQWKAVLGEYSTSYEYQRGDLPVSNASWERAQLFCDTATLALPSEAQWEYACRAGTTTRFSSGDSESDLARVAWCSLNSTNTVGLYERRVGGRKPANAFGLHDMHGNVWEWCRDEYDRDFYKKAAASRPDPLCTSGSAERVMRGGSAIDDAESCTCARRVGTKSWSTDYVQGIRPAYYPLPAGL